MLVELHIQNVAVIEKADIAFNKGLNVLTGETGAGKSIIIDSIGAILGGRVGKELVRKGSEWAMVTAEFDISPETRQWLEENDIEPDDTVVIQRRISAEGRNSCRICGCPVSVSQLRSFSSSLIDIHGQNDGQHLLDENAHLSYLDGFAKCGEELKAFKDEYMAYTEILRNISQLKEESENKEFLKEKYKRITEELSKAEIEAGECSALEQRRDLMRNSEKLTEALNSAIYILYDSDESVLSALDEAFGQIRRAASYAVELSRLEQVMDSVSFEVNDILETVRDLADNLDFSPDEYDRIESRISVLQRLQRKYRTDEEGLIKLLEQSEKGLSGIESADDQREYYEGLLKKQIVKCKNAAEMLSKKRREAAKRLQSYVQSELRDLNMPSAVFEVEFNDITGKYGFDSAGMDTVRFLISANAGILPDRISKIASGGELSRIMLALKNAFSENDPVGTSVFDEIDTGVSGITAQRVGEKLYKVSLGKQVLCVTHLPQIAALADNHLLIKKSEKNGRTYTTVDELNFDGRAEEIARLYGGDTITDTLLKGACEQLKIADEFKNSVT